MMKKFRFFCLIIIVLSATNTVTAQAWSWLKDFPGATIHDIKTAPGGTSYIAGSFPNFTLNATATPANYYMLKVDSAGKVVSGYEKEAQTFGKALQVETDEAGNLYVYGQPFTPQANNFYLKKFDSSGTLLWSRRLNANQNLTANSLRVMNDRIVLIGSYVQLLNVFQLNDLINGERRLGFSCDPDCADVDADPCPKYAEIFILNFSTDGSLKWLHSFGGPIYASQARDKYWCMVTEWDSPDYGIDAIIDKKQNTVLLSFFMDEVERIGQFLINRFINGPALIKIDPYGEIQWVNFIRDYYPAWPHFPSYSTIPAPQLGCDENDNIYFYNFSYEQEYDALMKFSSNGTRLWAYTWPADGKYYWTLDKAGNNYVLGNKLKKISANGILQWEKNPGPVVNTIGIQLDEDENLYHSGTNYLRKWVNRLPEFFTFTGSGNWSHPGNWEMELVPPAILPKWDTVFIQTVENDSCILDVQQTINEGAVLIINPGSHFIVPGDLLSDRFPEMPTAIQSLGKAYPAAQPGGKLFLQVEVTPGNHPVSSGLTVSVNLTPIGGIVQVLLNDDGVEGDTKPGDFIFGSLITLPDTVSVGSKNIEYIVQDAEDRADTGKIILSVLPKIGSGIVISQIYAGGGLTDATYTHDFVEIYNKSMDTLTLDGMSLQYATATGTDLFADHAPVLLNGQLNPGQYYLVLLAGGANGDSLPLAADANGAWDIAAAGAKIALVNGIDGLPCNGKSTPCNTEQKSLIRDLVGFGSANYVETKAAAAMQQAKKLALHRNGKGILDTDNNFNDFLLAYPSPKNTTTPARQPISKVVISQVQSGGGSMGYYNDYVELFNAGTLPADLTGWSLQYADSSSDTWQVVALSGIMGPGKYYLIKLRYNPYSTFYLPTPDASGDIDIHPLSGKVALVKNLTPLSGNGPTEDVIDFVGYGNANAYEGDQPAPSQGLNAIVRIFHGLKDDNQNHLDWVSRARWPKNSSATENALIPGMNESVMIFPDGSVYTSKKYGDRWWMTENVNLPGSRYYNDDTANGKVFGGLYSPHYYWLGYSNVDVEFDWSGPPGWVLPSNKDWKDLIFTGWNAEELIDTLHWENPTTNGTNKSGFNARPGGYYEVHHPAFEIPPYYAGKGFVGIYLTSDARYFDYDHIQYDLMLFFSNGSHIGSYWLDQSRNHVSLRLVK